MSKRRKSSTKAFKTSARPEDVVFETDITKADAILILGNKMKGAAKILAEQAASLHRKKLAPIIIASGGNTNQEGRLEADHIFYQLRALGVPADAIKIERRSTNTKENIAYSKTLAAHLPGFPKRPNIIVIGQRFASRRTLLTFAAQWPEATPMFAPVCMMGRPMHLWHTLPHAMHTVHREAAKIPEYREKGDLRPIDERALRFKIRRIKARNARQSARPSVS